MMGRIKAQAHEQEASAQRAQWRTRINELEVLIK